jgi:hypothetical protein
MLKSFVLILSSIGLATAATAAPKPVPLAPLVSGLTAEQLGDIRSTGAQIVLPLTLPSGFRVVKVSTTQKGRFGGSYGIDYQNSKGVCFAMLFVGGGVGGVDYEYRLPVKQSFFGEMSLTFGSRVAGKTNRPMKTVMNIRHPVLLTDWTQLPGTTDGANFYSLQSVLDARSPKGCQQTITPNEALTIIKSIDGLVER